MPRPTAPPPRIPRFALPPSPAALAAIALAFVLPGLAGHDPWKSHDAVGIGVAYQMAISGDPIVPRVADLAWLRDPPFFHWFAAAFAWILQFFIQFHAGARMASGAFMLAALWLAHVAARDWSLVFDHRTIT